MPKLPELMPELAQGLMPGLAGVWGRVVAGTVLTDGRGYDGPRVGVRPVRRAGVDAAGRDCVSVRGDRVPDLRGPAAIRLPAMRRLLPAPMRRVSPERLTRLRM
jgi:hypothetical protein